MVSQCGYFANEVALKDVADCHKQYATMRTKNWVMQFIEVNGMLPHYVDVFMPIEVGWEQFFYELVAEATEKPGTLQVGQKLADALLALVGELAIETLCAAKYGDGFRQLVDQLVDQRYLDPSAHFYHSHINALLLRFGCQTQYFQQRLTSCLCNQEQAHGREGEEGACVSRSCAMVVHHMCCRGLGRALGEMGLAIKTINMVMNFSKFFLNWDAISCLSSQAADAPAILKFLQILDLDNSRDVGKSMLQMANYMEGRRWAWNIYAERTELFRGKQLDTAVVFARMTRTCTTPAQLVAEMNAGIDDILARKQLENKHSSILSVDEQVRMYSRCQKLAKGLKMDDLFKRVFDFLKELAKDSKGAIKEYANQAWAVTLMVNEAMGDNKYLMVTMAPGSGKTYVVFLFMRYMQVHFPDQFREIAFCVPNVWLLEAANAIAKDFKFPKAPVVCLPGDLDRELNDNVLVLLDETVSTLKATTVTYRDKSPSATVYGLLSYGHTSTRVFFLNGFCMPNTDKFMREAYKDIEIVDLGRNQDYAQLQPQKPSYQVKCRPTLHELKIQLYEDIRYWTQRQTNVIVFGCQHSAEFEYAIPNTDKFFIGTDAQAKELPKQCFGLTSSVVFVDMEYRIGLDIRMQQEAKVFVLYEDLPDVEEMMQTLGRGARDMGAKLGNVYIVRPQVEELLLEDTFGASLGFDWHQGAQVLKALNSLKKLSDADQKWARIHLPGEWIATYHQYMQEAHPNFVKRLNAKMQ